MMVSLLWVGMFFNEVLNGLVSWRHKAPYPPSPVDVEHYIQEDAGQSFFPHTGDVQNTELVPELFRMQKTMLNLILFFYAVIKIHILFFKISFLLE